MKTSQALKRWKKPLIFAAIIVFLYTVVGFLVLPALIESLLPDRLGRALDRRVTLEKVRLNPYALSITLEKLSVAGKQGERFAGFNRLYANFQASSLLRWGAVVREIRLEGLYAHIVRTGQHRFNFSDLIPERKTAAEPNSEAEEGGAARFSVRRLAVSGAAVDFEDHFADSRHRIEGIDLSATDLSSLPAGTGKQAAVSFKAVVDGAALSLSAKANPFAAARSASASLSLKNLDLTRYLPYLPATPTARLDSAVLDFSLDAGFRTDESGRAALTLSGPVRLLNVAILDGQKRPMLRVPEMTAVLGGSDLLAASLVLDDIRIDAPRVQVLRGRDGDLNLLDLVPDLPEQKEGKDGGQTGGFSLLVKKAAVASGGIRFSDQAVAGGFEKTFSDIDISVRGFSLAPENSTDFSISLATDAKETVDASGAFSLEPARASGKVDVREVELKQYVPYLADRLNFKVNGGRLSVGGRFVWNNGVSGGPPALEIEEGKAALRSLALDQPGDRMRVLSIPTLDVNDVSFSLADRSVGIGEIASENGEISYLRHRDGRINLSEMVNMPASSESQEPSAASSAPFAATVDRIRLKGYRFRMEDRVPAETVSATLSSIRIEADGLSTKKGAKAKVALEGRADRGGTASLKGNIGVDPLSADLQVKVKRIDIRAFQPYFTDRVRIIVTGGAASAAGRFRLKASSAKEMPQIQYTGSVQLNGFKSVDKQDTLEFLDWESLHLADLDVRMPPFSLDLKEVGLSGLYSRFIIAKDGTINVADVVSTPEAAAAPKEKKAPAAAGAKKSGGKASAPKIHIGTVTLQDGHINFTDLFNPFNFHGDLTEIGGRVSGLTSLEKDRADVLLSGSWEDRAPLEIKGKINPLAEKRYADLTLTIKDIDLSPFSPYSGKFLGYKLEKGLLTLDLGYHLEGSHLKGDNRAYFQELTLGERVDSKDAVSLPVSLAISLLKDPSGAITLDVPVEGDLNDPQFSLARTVLRVIGNLIVKIVTAPFSWLGNLVGQNEELSYIAFDPGSAEITPKASEKIEALTDALLKRPALELEIQGDADPDADPDAMRKRRFDDLIRSQKLKEMTANGKTAVPLNEVIVTPEEYPRYLQKAYDAADFAKPRDSQGRLKRLSPEEMEKLLMTQFIFSDSDLRQLAVERADAVKSRMLEDGAIRAGRLLIVEPKIVADSDDKEAISQSRVRFTLR